MSVYDNPRAFIREQLETGPHDQLQPYQIQALQHIADGNRIIVCSPRSAGTRRLVDEMIARYSEVLHER